MKRRAALAALFALLCAAVWAQSFGTTSMDRPPAVIKSGAPRDSLILELLPQNYRYVAGGTDTWWDSTGNGYNFTQSTAANKPVYNPKINAVQFRNTDSMAGSELPINTAHTFVIKMVAYRSWTAASSWTAAQFNNVGGIFGTVTVWLKATSGDATDFTFPNATQSAWVTYNSASSERWPKSSIYYEDEGEPFFLASRYDETETPKLTVFKFACKAKSWNPAVEYSTSSFNRLPHYEDIAGACRLGSNASGAADILGLWVFNTDLATSTILDAINW